MVDEDEEEELAGTGVLEIEAVESLFFVRSVLAAESERRAVETLVLTALMEGDLFARFVPLFVPDAFGILSFIGSTFMGGRYKDCTVGGFARLPGSV